MHNAFFIIGAPKCGTTSLARWLERHSNIFLSPIKEPHYFSTDLANRTVASSSAYTRLFKSAGARHLAVGEASTWYLYSREAIPSIERSVDDPQYIVMTRDPVSMVHSLYRHNRRVLHEDQPTFEAAWRLQEQRAAGRNVPATCVEPAFLQYRAACSLGSLLERLYENVPKERVLHIPLECMQTDAGAEYRRVLRFLGVPDDGRDEFPPENAARGHRNRILQRVIRKGARARRALGIGRGFGLARINAKRESPEELPDTFLAELEESFAEERNMLKAMTREP